MLNGPLGVAVSGGVDSMALAALCSRLPLDEGLAPSFPPHFSFRAFIVDHGLRDGSSTEAKAVSRLLEQRG